MKVSEVNLTSKAKKRIQGIADNNNLDYDFVYSVISFNWNYDPKEGSWVAGLEEDEEYKNRYQLIQNSINYVHTGLDKKHVVSEIFNNLQSADRSVITSDFIYGANQKSYCLVSRYASINYLNNATIENLMSLQWQDKDLNLKVLVRNIFLKIFRGGAIERYNLEYLYADLVVNLPFIKPADKLSDWTGDFIKIVEQKSGQMKLSDLREELKNFIKGDKFFLQTVLEALSFANALKVDGRPIEDCFIPDYRNESSGHFSTNEWAFPLRFWNGQDKK